MDTSIRLELLRAANCAERGGLVTFAGIPEVSVEVLRRAERLYRKFSRDPFDYIVRWHYFRQEKLHAHQA